MENSDTRSMLPQSSSDGGGVDSRRQLLSDSALQTIAGQLAVRLGQRQNELRSRNQATVGHPTREEIDAFCDALIAPDTKRAHRAFEVLRERDVTPDVLCLDYFASAARLLGERWVADTCGFLEVTLGCARLHAFQRQLHHSFTPASSFGPLSNTALFSAIPGETHVFGVSMAADFFRRAGWMVDLNTVPDAEILFATACAQRYDVIGLSMACESAIDTASITVQRLRELQPDAKIILGGELTKRDEHLAERIGADSIVNDVRTAPIALERTKSRPINH